MQTNCTKYREDLGIIIQWAYINYYRCWLTRKVLLVAFIPAVGLLILVRVLWFEMFNVF